MADYDYDLGIIGGGAAGLTAAAGAARFGAKTVLIEKSPRLGGDCLHTGCVPSKTLIKSARLRHMASGMGAFGLPPVTLPSVDLGSVMDRVASVIARIQKHDSPERFCGLGVRVLFGSPEFADDHSVLVDGERITSRSWIIATGSSPSLPPVQGLDSVDIWTSDNLFLQRKLPERLIVLGGGPVGMELGQSFSRLGSRVTVVEYLDRILGAEDADVSALLCERMKEEGMNIMTSTKAVRVWKENSNICLALEPVNTGGAPITITGDALLVAAGRKPNISGLGLDIAGVHHGPRGISVDGRLRTNRGHIHACGDVNGAYPFTHVAGLEAGIAISNAILRLPRKVDYSLVPWCTYTDPEIAGVGLNESKAKGKGVEYRLFTADFADNDRALTEGEAFGKIKVLAGPHGRILGCQIIGSAAGELIHEWAAAMSGNLKLSTIAQAVHLYPTLSEISKKTAGDYYAEKIFSDNVKKALRALFSLKGRASC